MHGYLEPDKNRLQGLVQKKTFKSFFFLDFLYFILMRNVSALSGHHTGHWLIKIILFIIDIN